MGNKYTVRFTRNGTCDYDFDWDTQYFIVALFWMIKLRVVRKYKIITLEIRAGYTACEDCTADYCERSPVVQGREGETQ